MNYSELQTNEEKIDMVLRYVVNIPSRELLTRDQIASNMDAVTYEKEITEILLKLHKDGFIYTPNELGTGYFYSNFDGRMFVQNGGYEAKALKDANEASWKQSEIDRRRTLDDLLASNSTDLNVLTSRMAKATLFAGIAGLLLFLWQIVLWYFPTHSDYPFLWIWETIPKKKL